MKLATITLQFLADDEASARRRIANLTDEHADARCSEPIIEDASLDDEDDFLGHDQAAQMRAMDALRRTSMPLLIEIAKEVRDGPYRAAENGYKDDGQELRNHIADLFSARISDALLPDFPEDDVELGRGGRHGLGLRPHRAGRRLARRRRLSRAA